MGGKWNGWRSFSDTIIAVSAGKKPIEIKAQLEKFTLGINPFENSGSGLLIKNNIWKSSKDGEWHT